MKHPLSLQSQYTLLKSIVIRSVLASALLCVTLPSLANETKQLTTIIDAKPIDRVVPKYPRGAARMGREGWAKLSFVIEKDGSVSNILVMDTVGHKAFAKKAIQALKKWKYSPALENGKPVQQCNTAVQLDFLMSPDSPRNPGGPTIVSQKFFRIYRTAIKALDDKDLELAKEKINKIDHLKVWKLADASYANLLKAKYANLINNDKDELMYLNSSLSRRTKTFDDDTYFFILQQIYALNIKLNHFSKAYSTLTEILSLEKAKPDLDVYKQHKAKLDAYINSDKDIIINGDLADKPFWFYTLLRNSFSLVKLTGDIRELDIRCANKRHVFSVGENSTWDIPKKWQKCSVYVKGDKNSTFKLVEHAKSAKQQTTASL